VFARDIDPARVACRFTYMGPFSSVLSPPKVFIVRRCCLIAAVALTACFIAACAFIRADSDITVVKGSLSEPELTQRVTAIAHL
jgi:hypothetical protein